MPTRKPTTTTRKSKKTPGLDHRMKVKRRQQNAFNEHTRRMNKSRKTPSRSKKQKQEKESSLQILGNPIPKRHLPRNRVRAAARDAERIDRFGKGPLAHVPTPNAQRGRVNKVGPTAVQDVGIVNSRGSSNSSYGDLANDPYMNDRSIPSSPTVSSSKYSTDPHHETRIGPGIMGYNVNMPSSKSSNSGFTGTTRSVSSNSSMGGGGKTRRYKKKTCRNKKCKGCKKCDKTRSRR